MGLWELSEWFVRTCCVVFLRKQHCFSTYDVMFSCKREDVLHQETQVETGLVRLFGSWITGFNGRDQTA